MLLIWYLFIFILHINDNIQYNVLNNFQSHNLFSLILIFGLSHRIQQMMLIT